MNNQTNPTTGRGESKYARKFRRGRMMYGPGCCGHRYRAVSLEFCSNGTVKGVAQPTFRVSGTVDKRKAA